jgi:putative transposase
VHWILDFVSDTFGAARKLRNLTVKDDRPREKPGLIADTSLSGARVARGLTAMHRINGKPGFFVSENGTEFISTAILKWATDTDAAWHYIDPGKPRHKDLISSFNSRLSDECLNEEIFDSLGDASQKLALWRYDDNSIRPLSSLGSKTPQEVHRVLEQPMGTAPGALAQPETDNFRHTRLAL